MKFISLAFACIFPFLPLCHGYSVEDFEIKTAVQIGNEIYEQDAIAAEATDVLLAQDLDLSQYPIRGWIVEKNKKESIVTFIGEFDSKLLALFELRKKGQGALTYIKLDKKDLSAYQLAAFQARSLALESIKEPCSDRYNSVVLDNPTSPGFLVYAIAATMDPNAIMLGGHYRFTISEDGKKLEKAERLSSSCLALDKSPESLPEGSTSAGFMVTHMVSERPLETHIFLSLLHKIDLFVSTSDETVWMVQDGTMEKIKMDN